MPLRSLLMVGLLFATLWWVLVRAPTGLPAIDVWLVGGLAVFLSVALFRRMARPPVRRLRWRRLPGLLLVFFRHSLAGGIDVTRRILSPRLRLRPGFATLESILDDDRDRVLLLLVSLMPGTLGVRLEGRRLTLHALDLDLPIEVEMRDLERRIEGLFHPLANHP